MKRDTGNQPPLYPEVMPEPTVRTQHICLHFQVTGFCAPVLDSIRDHGAEFLGPRRSPAALTVPAFVWSVPQCLLGRFFRLFAHRDRFRRE